MRIPLLLGALALAGASLSAQNFVVNGDFTGDLTGWTQGGISYNPIIETYDVSGLGASKCFACGPGGQVYAPPHAPNWIEQTIVFAQGAPYEFSADVLTLGPNSNADSGDCYVEVNNVQVGRIYFKNSTGGKAERSRFTFRFTPNASGPLNFRVNFVRVPYIFNASTPRMYIDNISVAIAPAPTFLVRGLSGSDDNMMLGKAVDFKVDGGATLAGSACAIFLAAAEQKPPIRIPGAIGTWNLDLLTMALLGGGTADASGQYAINVTIPMVPALTVLPTWFQAVGLNGGTTLAFGFHHPIVFVN